MNATNSNSDVTEFHKLDEPCKPQPDITSHKVNGLNNALRIQVLDQPGEGGACHEYGISCDSNDFCDTDIFFQNGPILEAGFNGVSIEALLAIVEHRMIGFQSGEYSTRENAIALTKIQEAMLWLHKRTLDRVARGVEGTHQI